MTSLNTLRGHRPNKHHAEKSAKTGVHVATDHSEVYACYVYNDDMQRTWRANRRACSRGLQHAAANWRTCGAQGRRWWECA